MARWSTAFLILSSLALPCAAQDVPPPPKPADSGPSLDVTMKFIQDRLKDSSAVGWVTTLHDVVAQNAGAPEKLAQSVGEVTVTPGACTVAYRRTVVDDRRLLRHLWWTYTFSPIGQQRRDWVQTSVADWFEINEDGSRAHFQVVGRPTLNGIAGTTALKEDKSLTAFIPDRDQPGTFGRWLLMQFTGQDAWQSLAQFVEDSREVDERVGIDLRSVETVQVLSLEEEENSWWAAKGLPETKESVGDPMPYVVAINLRGGRQQHVIFRDQTTADRIAKALVHAVELCGGGNKEPF
jgi:hypothetical protein